eukprot:TCONS_00057148-protein
MDDYPQDYAEFIENGEHINNYMDRMGNSGEWADAAIIRATADALQIEIHVISSNMDHIETFTPPGHTETIFLGQVMNIHYVSTSNIRQPQTIPFGGVTSDGISLTDTSGMNISLTWFFNFMKKNPVLTQKISDLKATASKKLMRSFGQFRVGKSAEAKRLWYELIKSRKLPLSTSSVNAANISDLICLEPVHNHGLTKFMYKKAYGSCSSKDCKWKIPDSREFELNRTSIDLIKTFHIGERERCPECAGHFIGENRLTVASPFLIIFGDGNSMHSFPESVILKENDHPLCYDLQFISLKTENTKRCHYSSFMKYGDTHWTFFEQFVSGNPIRNFLTLPRDTEQQISFVIYICLALLQSFSPTFRQLGKKRSIKNDNQKPNKCKKVIQ